MWSGWRGSACGLDRKERRPKTVGSLKPASSRPAEDGTAFRALDEWPMEALVNQHSDSARCSHHMSRYSARIISLYLITSDPTGPIFGPSGPPLVSHHRNINPQTRSAVH